MYSDKHSNWRDNEVETHFARSRVAFIRDRSEVCYILEYATPETLAACKELGEHVPELGQWAVVHRAASPDRTLKSRVSWHSASEVLQLAHSEGWHIPPGPGGTPGWWDGHGQWVPVDLGACDFEDELPPEV